ncbi:E-selectin-like [Corticium candelabrum]|uniref:E-selectin-like n=1 Tax=Corticium candelabrum TaxID=121492 RepID=UPI002E273E86|nr:E-selectin-like [Corticium candelabrum]
MAMTSGASPISAATRMENGLTLTRNLLLSFPLAIVTKNCGKPRVLQNAKFTEKSYVFPNKVTYKCKKGYCAKGNLSTRCLANGKWSAEDRSCKRVKCSMLTSPMNGSVRPDMNQEITVGFQANFACNPGFILNGSSTIYCQQKENPFDCQGKWSENEPICERNDVVPQEVVESQL